MSWITRCPDCDTVYKVASAQLQQAQGWLRCGTCQHVFDSAGRVVAADVIPTLTDPINVGAPQLGRVDLDRLLHTESPAPVKPLSVESPEAVVTVAASEASSITAFEDALQSFKVPDLPVTDTGARTSGSEPASRASMFPARGKRQVSVWLVCLLVLVLAFQVLWACRPALLAHWPQWGRWLAQWCSASVCRAQWQPPLSLWSLQAQTVVLDGEHPRLDWTLVHSAPVSLTVPDLQLTLLNAQGQPSSSRRLTAAMMAAPDTLATGQAWQGALQLDSVLNADVHRAQLRLIPR